MRWNPASLRLLLGVLLLLPFFVLACGNEEKVVERIVPTPHPTTGLIEGDVQDKGTGVPGASVTLNPGGLQATTDSQGKFSYQDVDVGAYSLTVAATGYNTVTRSNVIVVRGGTTNLVFALLAVGAAPVIRDSSMSES